MKAFQEGLKEAGFVEGQNVVIEYRSGDNDRDQLRLQVRDLIHLPVAVIVGNVVAAVAAKSETTIVPILFATGSDPVEDRLVESLNHPGGNVTGVTFLGGVVGGKRLELLRQLAPRATNIAMLVTPRLSNTEAERRDVLAAALKAGQQIIVFDVENVADIEAAFATFSQRGVGAVFVGTGAFLTSNREQLTALANRHALPSSFTQREAAESGGLMSYGTSQTGAYRQVGFTPAGFSRARDQPTCR